jgi:Kdo2-lipid IVA lauroyltransferase/acyltransferase
MNALLKLLSALPLSVLHRLGTLGGWIVFLASKRYRDSLRRNLNAAGFGDSMHRHRAIAEAGKAVLEVSAIWLRPQADVVRLVTHVSGAELIDAARERGHGVVLLTPHLGCFEICAQWCSYRDPLTVLYRPPKQQRLEPAMRAGRGRPNITLAPTDMSGVRKLLRALRRREAVGILPDQVPSFGEGEWADFFGRPAYTMTLIPRLLEVTGAELILVYGERLPRGAGFHLRFSRPPEPLTGESAARYTNRAVETMVRECPTQYLWAYNRYKAPAGLAPPSTAAKPVSTA